MTYSIDTAATIRRLERAGCDRNVAIAIVDAIRNTQEGFATLEDIKDLRLSIGEADLARREDMKIEIQQVEHSLKKEIQQVELSLMDEIQKVDFARRKDTIDLKAEIPRVESTLRAKFQQGISKLNNSINQMLVANFKWIVLLLVGVGWLILGLIAIW